MKRHKPLRRMSKRRQLQMKEYYLVRAAYLSENPVCENCGERLATEIHHISGRIGKRLNDSEYFMALCGQCHRTIHFRPSEARKKGLLA